MHAFTYICFPSDNFLNIFKSKRITWTLLLSNKNIGYYACLKENEHLVRYRPLALGNFFRCVGARAHLRALMTRKIVRCRDAQCNTVKSPQRLTYGYRKTTLESLCWPVYDFFKIIASYL